jgi:hypothetical protein
MENLMENREGMTLLGELKKNPYSRDCWRD